MNTRVRQGTPYAHTAWSTQTIMLLVIAALLPAAGFGIYSFGRYALFVLLLSSGSAMLFELLADLAMRRPLRILDPDAALTGLLAGLVLPPYVSLWVPVAASFVAIVICRAVLGDRFGRHINGALAAKCLLQLLDWPEMMRYSTGDTTFITPLDAFHNVLEETGDTAQALATINAADLMRGNQPGAIGEISLIAITAGACILLLAGIIDLRIPGACLFSFTVCLFLFAPVQTVDYRALQFAGGGLMLGAFFLATDYRSSPVTRAGQYLYGALIGILIAVFRISGLTEGTAEAILICNLLTPLIERFTVPKPFGFRAEPHMKGTKKKRVLPEEEEEEEEPEEEPEEELEEEPEPEEEPEQELEEALEEEPEEEASLAEAEEAEGAAEDEAPSQSEEEVLVQWEELPSETGRKKAKKR